VSATTSDALPHLRRTAIWSAALVVVWSLILGPWLGWPMVVGLAAGALVGLLNLWLGARALALLIPRLSRGNTKDNRTALTLLLLMKWPLVLLALLGILWYLPARPEGVALGVAISLAAASIAWLRRPTAAPNDAPS
jgi:hypothetical protein